MTDPWNVNRSIPMLSDMVLINKTITHSDKDGLYSVIIQPGSGLVVLFGHTLLSDKCWAAENIWSDSTTVKTQQRKCESPQVREELVKLQKTAERHRVPMQNALLVDCSDNVPLAEIAEIAQNAFAKDCSFDTVREKVFSRNPNIVGNALTAVARDEVWCIHDMQ